MTGHEAAEEFARHRPRLLGVAYRMLGSMWDAEDVVADAQVRWLGTDRAEVRQPVAFLTTMVTRLALDQLRSARHQREGYLGPWLPEPVLTDPSPLETATRSETVSIAVLHLLEKLSPPERAVFILREVFDVPYADVAGILDVTPGHARQLLFRARARVTPDADRPPALPQPDPRAHEHLLRLLLGAARNGDLDPLRERLADDVVSYNDGGGKARAAVRPVVGAGKVARFVAGLTRRFDMGDDVRIVEVNGLPAALFTMGDQEQLAALDVHRGMIRAIYGVVNPDKLSYLRGQLRDLGTRAGG